LDEKKILCHTPEKTTIIKQGEALPQTCFSLIVMRAVQKTVKANKQFKKERAK